jgi:hypothetical protein
VYVRKNYTVADYPEELKSKLYHLKHFESYIMGKLYGDYEYTFLDLQRTKCMHFVQKYLRMKHVIVFKLSHDVLQVRALRSPERTQLTPPPPPVQLLRPLEDHTLGAGPLNRPHRQELRAHALDAKPSDGARAPPAVFGPRTSQVGTAPAG